MSRRIPGVVVAAVVAAIPIQAQDFSALRINEVIADNATTDPADVAGSRPDMIEIRNTGNVTVTLGTSDKRASIALSDRWFLPDPLPPPQGQPIGPIPVWTFRSGVTIPAGGSIIVFCDGNSCQDTCEPHADFQVDSDGSEPITLWGPEVGGTRPIIDQVWLPPLRSDVSFSRLDPSPSSRAPVPIQETFEHFGFTPGSSASFGSCFNVGGVGTCALGCGDYQKRFCRGRDNLPPVNLEPRVNRFDHSTNAPAAGEAVTVRVEVRDDKLPAPRLEDGSPNIVSVRLRYRVDGVEREPIVMAYEADTGVQPDISDFDPDAVDRPRFPLDRFSIWSGVIPGQPAGSTVQFIYEVADAEGASSTRPRAEDICEFGVGPCSENFGGHPDCELDPLSGSCGNDECQDLESGPGCDSPYFLTGVRYRRCDAWFRYRVGYAPRPELAGLVINEIVPSQTVTVRDPSSLANSPYCNGPNPPQYCCVTRGEVQPSPTCGYDDFIEIYNASATAIPLEGLWLSDSFFDPRGWSFPSGAALAPGAYAIVWLDGDGGECPGPRGDPDPDCVALCETLAANPNTRCRDTKSAQVCADECIAANCVIPCFWDCPDPTDIAAGRYHASFRIDADNDQIFLFDSEANGYGLIHGFVFRAVPADRGLSLCPNGDRRGSFVVREITHRASNFDEETCPDVALPSFKRGDASNSCGIDLSDAVYVLNWLFLGGTAPPCPDAADTNDSGGIDLSDAVAVLNWLFLGGTEPPAPGPNEPGPDPTDDELADCIAPDCA